MKIKDKGIHMQKLLAWCGLCTALVFSGVAAGSESASKEVVKESGSNLDVYSIVKDVVTAAEKGGEKSSELMELKLQVQAEKIVRLEREIERLKDKPESNTSSTVLAAASVIITALGVLIAILSILGYTNIKKEAVRVSADTAKQTVASIADVELMNATESNIVKLMENGRFDEIIRESIASVAYRGISISDEFEEEEEPK